MSRAHNAVFAMALATAAIGGSSALPILTPLLAATGTRDPEPVKKAKPESKPHDASPPLDWGFRMVQYSGRLTHSEKRKLRRNVRVTVSRQFALEQAQAYYAIHAITGYEEKHGRKRAVGVRPKWANRLYREWCAVLQYGVYTVDGEVVSIA